MAKINLPSNVTRAFHKGLFQLKKHSPEILVVTGIVGGVASAVMACKASTKVNLVVETTKKKLDIIHTATEAGETEVVNEDGNVEVVPYSEDDGKKDTAIVYAQTGLEFVKMYGPAVILGIASIGCILTSTNIMRKRNLALAAAYAVESTGFKEYRNRVIDRFGEELDRELKYDVKAKQIEETVVNEDGTESKVSKTVQVATINENSDYARFFDEYCLGWVKDSESNLNFLKGVERFANQKLKERGFLYLNEVYEMLGIPMSKAGQRVGWIYDDKNPDHVGDNYVSFGIYDLHNETKRAFVNGYEQSILLDFNVDGDIWSMMK